MAILPTAIPAEEPAAQPDAPALAFFEKNVRPLLSKRCYQCHSHKAEKLKGGLLLDSKAGWEKGGDSGPAVVPGEVDDSLLIQAVRYDGLEMPPTGKLKPAEIAVLEKWVRMGAPDPRTDAAPQVEEAGIDFEQARQFWAFQPPRRGTPPEVQDKTWPTGDVDRYVLHRLESAGLRPAPDADRRTWLRRVTFDLTGLPPTPEEVEAFVADESPTAYETVVDRLLASPHFGEQWGRHWLDVARYADSNGGDINLTYYNAWRYRDYVIEAFNRDKPFDRFIREQIAGDLMPYESDEQRAEQLVATGLLIVGPKMLSERDKEKLYMDVADEQIDSLGRAFLGLTLGCARCHDHKFDPIPTTDYYALAGIFRSTETVFGIRMNNVNVSGWLERKLPMKPEHLQALARHKAATDKIAGQIKKLQGELKQLQNLAKLMPEDLQGVVVDNTQAELKGTWKASTYVPRFVGEGYIHDDKQGKGEKSVTFTPDLPAEGLYEVRISYASGNGRDKRVPVAVRHAEGETQLEIDQGPLPEIGGLFKRLGQFRFQAGKAGSVTISNRGTTDYVIADAAQFVPVELLKGGDDADAKNIAGDAGERRKRRQDELNAEIKKLQAEKKKLDESAPPPPLMAMAVRDHEQTSDCGLCIRGEVHNRGEPVPRGFLTVLRNGEEPEVDPQQSGRLALARWISDPQNPLPPRVLVNRVWHHLFGRGLVESVDNFGHQGARPTHPKLLDYLAVRCIEDGWSVKSVIRRLALSRAYRQSTRHDAEAAAADPNNALLWRQRRRRLPAESIRDAVLAISRQLDRTAGGSSVAELGEQAIDNTAKQEGGGHYENNTRRSVYLPIVRNDLPPFLTVFDFADPEMVTGRRAVTTVPAQALLMLNSPMVRRAAERTAAQLLEGASADDASVADRAYRQILGRPATEAEQRRAAQFVAGFTQNIADGTDAESARRHGWADFCQMLFASTEFRFLD